MSKRYYIRIGDTTTAGGVVQTGISSTLLDGKPLSYENDQVYCPACDSVGVIQLSGSRIGLTGPDGRQVALSDDLCICECSPPPLLVSTQTMGYTGG